MAIKHPNKTGTADSIANLGNYEKNLAKAALFPVKSDGTIDKQDVGVFLLNPASYEDSKSANWTKHVVPGQSDPIMQWVSSGERVVTFEALVTADTSYLQENNKEFSQTPGKQSDPIKKVIDKVAGIAGAFFQTAIPESRNNDVTKVIRPLDIHNYLNYYRSLLYPKYDNKKDPTTIVSSPPILVLYAGRSVVKLKYENKVSKQHDLWVLTDLKIRVTKQLPDLAPLEAVVQFTLVQYNTTTFDGRRFY